MAKNKNLIITRSNYSVKEKHKKLEDKIFYERDFMTTTNLGGYDSSVIPYGEGNFKFVHRNNQNSGKRRRHSYGGWMEAPDGDSSWTLTNSRAKYSTIVEEGNPVPKYDSLLDFCYYGSCAELVRNSIVNIIKNFTGELYVSYHGMQVGDHMLGDDLGLSNPVIVENPYEIDITSAYKKNVENELRYFFLSRNKYKIVDNKGETVSCFAQWDVVRNEKDCYDEDGEKVAVATLMERAVTTATTEYFRVYQYYYAGNMYLIADGDLWSGYHIRPIDSEVKKYRETLNDFEKLLLNVDSNPLYTATLAYEYEDEYGIVSGQRQFTWPTTDGWNLDISSASYQNYSESLLNLASYYDDRYSDCLWRMMIHDPVKKLDTTIIGEEARMEDYKADVTSFQNFICSLGWFYDKIKLDIDNIGRLQNTVYNEEGETSEHLSNIVESKGWEITRVADNLDDGVTVKNLYPNSKKVYGLTELNKTFLNYLNINSASLFRQKGTKKCVESVLGLFGLTSYDYARSLYQHLPENKKVKVNGKIKQWDDLDEEEKISRYDYRLDEYVVVASNTSGDVIDSEEQLAIEKYHPVMDNEDKTLGLPVKIFYCTKIGTDGQVTEMKYMVPWFKNAMTDENRMYFQMYGGWEKMQSKTISLSIAPNITEIYSDSNFRIYDETVNYVKLMDTINNLVRLPSTTFRNGMIYYIEDISDISSYNTGYTDPSKLSNYFILRDKEYCNEISVRGWEPITLADVQQGKNDGIKVLYLESIVDDSRGNNPHVGYLDYDDGMGYLDYFKQVFKYYIDEDLFGSDYYDCTTGELLSGITNAGFTLSDLVKDNVKCWYFTDTYETPVSMLNRDVRQKKTEEGDTITADYGYKKTNINYPVYVGKKGTEKDTYPYSSDLKAFNLETQESDSHDEAAANSVINMKNLKLTFNTRISTYSGFKAYLYGVILKYVRQVIPSTTIWGVILEGAEADYQCFRFPTIVGTVNK